MSETAKSINERLNACARKNARVMPCVQAWCLSPMSKIYCFRSSHKKSVCKNNVKILAQPNKTTFVAACLVIMIMSSKFVIGRAEAPIFPLHFLGVKKEQQQFLAVWFKCLIFQATRCHHSSRKKTHNFF